jgi:hypothetical protein
MAHSTRMRSEDNFGCPGDGEEARKLHKRRNADPFIDLGMEAMV